MNRNEFYAKHFKELVEEIDHELNLFSLAGENQFAENKTLSGGIFKKMLLLSDEFYNAVVLNQKSGRKVSDTYYQNKEAIAKQKNSMKIKVLLS